MDADKIETLWEITSSDDFDAEAFRTHKGTFLTIRRGTGVVTLTQENARMILATLEDYAKRKDAFKGNSIP